MAPTIRSVGERLSTGACCQRYKTIMMPTNESEFKKKTAHEPVAATTKPPSAGPTARAMLKATLLRETAAGSSERGTNSGMIACHAGALSADPRPRQKININKTHGVVSPNSVSTASETADSNIHPCV